MTSTDTIKFDLAAGEPITARWVAAPAGVDITKHGYPEFYCQGVLENGMWIWGERSPDSAPDAQG